MFQHVRYHEADIFEFERQSAQHWMAILGYGERIPRAVAHPPKAEGDPPSSDAVESELHYISAKEIIEATGLSALNCPLVFVQRKGSTRLFLVGTSKKVAKKRRNHTCECCYGALNCEPQPGFMKKRG